MSIIAVSEESFSGGRHFAKALAKKLGVRYVDAAILVERAAAWSGDRKRLEAAPESAPDLLDRFIPLRHSQILVLQAALAQEVRGGNAVCYGAAADLLNVPAGEIIRIRVESSHHFRRLEVQENLGLHGGEAERYLHERDWDERGWHLYLFAAKMDSPGPRDLTFDFGQTSLDEACAAVSDFVNHRSRISPHASDLASLERFATSTRLRAALAQEPQTLHPGVDVDVRGDTGLARGTCTPFPGSPQANALLSPSPRA